MKEYEFKDIYTAFYNFSSDLSPVLLEKKSLIEGKNVLVKEGYIEKLKGWKYFNDINSPLGEIDYRNILNISVYKKEDGSQKLMAITPRRLYFLSSDGWQEITSTLYGSNDDIVSFINMDNKFIFVQNSVGIIRYWDGTNFGNLFTPPDDIGRKAQFITEHKLSLILARTIEDGVEYPQRIWASFPGNPTLFYDDDKLDIAEKGVINNIGISEDYIIVYYEKAIFLVYDSGERGYLYTIISPSKGLIAPKSLASDGITHYFLSQEGLVKLAGRAITPLSYLKFNRLLLSKIDPQYYYKAIGFLYPDLNLYFICFPKVGTSYNNYMLIYDVVLNELVGVKDFFEKPTIFSTFRKELSQMTPDERLQYGVYEIPLYGDEEGLIYEQKDNYFASNGNPFETSMEFKPEYLGDVKKHKRILKVTIIMNKYDNANINFVLILKNEKDEQKEYPFIASGIADEEVEVYTDFCGKEIKPILKDINNISGYKIKALILEGNYLTEK